MPPCWRVTFVCVALVSVVKVLSKKKSYHSYHLNQMKEKRNLLKYIEWPSELHTIPLSTTSWSSVKTTMTLGGVFDPTTSFSCKTMKNQQKLQINVNNLIANVANWLQRFSQNSSRPTELMYLYIVGKQLSHINYFNLANLTTIDCGKISTQKHKWKLEIK